MSEQKRTLVVLTKAPYQGQMAREALDVILTSAAFETPLSVLFTGDAVYQLLNAQHAEAINAKSMSASLPVLPVYDVENLFVDADSAAARGLTASDFLMPVKALELHNVQALFHEHDRVLSF